MSAESLLARSFRRNYYCSASVGTRGQGQLMGMGSLMGVVCMWRKTVASRALRQFIVSVPVIRVHR
jgi:hypothetical protein